MKRTSCALIAFVIIVAMCQSLFAMPLTVEQVQLPNEFFLKPSANEEIHETADFIMLKQFIEECKELLPYDNEDWKEQRANDIISTIKTDISFYELAGIYELDKDSQLDNNGKYKYLMCPRCELDDCVIRLDKANKSPTDSIQKAQTNELSATPSDECEVSFDDILCRCTQCGKEFKLIEYCCHCFGTDLKKVCLNELVEGNDNIYKTYGLCPCGSFFLLRNYNHTHSDGKCCEYEHYDHNELQTAFAKKLARNSKRSILGMFFGDTDSKQYFYLLDR